MTILSTSVFAQTTATIVSERRSVGTLTLAVGTITDSVTVQAAVTPVQTESAERSSNIDSHEIGALLARGLNCNGLIRSLPGLSGASDPNSPNTSYQPYGSINGTRWRATVPTLNGVMAADTSSQGQLQAVEATDALSEIHINTSNYQAEYGQSGGAIINLTTKSGTKEFHGKYGEHSVTRWFDPTVFAQPALGYIGSSPTLNDRT